jgi:hypothetical protein
MIFMMGRDFFGRTSAAVSPTKISQQITNHNEDAATYEPQCPARSLIKEKDMHSGDDCGEVICIMTYH